MAAEGYLQCYWEGDLSVTKEIFRSNRLDWLYARLMGDAGLHREVEHYFRFYLEGPEPHDIPGWIDLAGGRGSQRNIEGTIAAVRAGMRLTPPDSFNVMWPFTWVLPRTGRIEEAEVLIERGATFPADSHISCNPADYE